MTVISSDENYRTVMIRLQERMDARTAAGFRSHCDTLFTQGVTHFIIDLSETHVIDSSGIAVLVNLFRRSRQAGGYMKLTKAMSPAAQRILRLTRFDQIFEVIEQSEAEQILTAAGGYPSAYRLVM